MKKQITLEESALPEAAPRQPKSAATAPVAVQKTIRETSRRVSPSRASGRPVERHDQRRQPKGGRHKEGS